MKPSRKLAIPGLIITIVLTAAPALAADAAKGKAAFVKCHFCHQMGETAKNAVGPPLNGVVGRAAGAVPDYHYSEALKASGITWDEATLRAFLASPRAVIPATKMTFAGIGDPAAIDDVIAYLKQFRPDGSITP